MPYCAGYLSTTNKKLHGEVAVGDHIQELSARALARAESFEGTRENASRRSVLLPLRVYTVAQ